MKYLRLRAGKRLEEIAAESGASMSSVRNWDAGRNPPRMTPVEMQRLMQVYNCTFDELVEAERQMMFDRRSA